MSAKFRVGYCVNCGEQAYARDFRGRLLAPMPGTKLFYIVLSDDEGHECRVGTMMCCKDCDPEKMSIDDIKKVLFESKNVSGVSGDEPEWMLLPNARIEVVQEFKRGF